MVLEMSEELAEFVGVLLGDGSIGRYTSHPNGSVKTQYRIKVTGHSTEDLPYFKDYVSPLMTRILGKEPLLRFKSNEQTVELLLFGRQFYGPLIQLGLKPAPKRDNAVIPEFIAANGFESDFIRGLFDTDGCLVFDKQHTNHYYYPRLEIKLLPSPMRDQFIQMLQQVGFKIMLHPKLPSDAVVRVQINGEAQLVRWVSSIGFNNPRHKTKYLMWEKLGHCPPHTTLQDRIDMLSPI